MSGVLMFLEGLRYTLPAFALLGILAASARAQVSPAPPTPPPAGDATTPSPALPSSDPAPPPAAGSAPAAGPSGTAASAPSVPGPDPALAKLAAEAKASGKVLYAASASAVAACRDLGGSSAESDAAGMIGRARIRVELRRTAADRGASHILFSAYRDGVTQSETARFYDCTAPDPAAKPEPPRASSIFASAYGMLAVQLELVPEGTVSAETGGVSAKADTATTFGVSTSLDYVVVPYLSLGVAPRLTFGIRTGGATLNATQLDLRARARIGDLSSDVLAIHGYATAGRSWIYFPMDVTSSGFTFGVGLAMNCPIGHSRFITFDIGYQSGDQSATDKGVDINFSSSLIHLGVGLG